MMLYFNMCFNRNKSKGQYAWSVIIEYYRLQNALIVLAGVVVDVQLTLAEIAGGSGLMDL